MDRAPLSHTQDIAYSMTISGLHHAFDSNSAMNDLTTWVVYFVGTVDWNTVESCPTYFGVEDVELKELADALKILHVYCDTKDWNEDDFISVFEELTGAHYRFFHYLRAESYSVM